MLVQRVLLLLNAGLGNTVQALPAIREIRRLKPEWRLCLFAAKPNADLLDSPELADEIHTLAPGESLMRHLARNPRLLFRKYQYIFSFFACNPGRAILLKKAGLTNAICSVRSPSNASYRHDRFVDGSPEEPEYAQDSALLKLAGLMPNGSQIADLALSEEEKRFGRDFFCGERPFLIHPGWIPGNMLKALPEEFVTELIGKIEQETIPVRLLLGPKEKTYAKSLKSSEAWRKNILAEPFTPRQLASVLAAARLLISADTGPAHIAGAAGGKTVMIVSATGPEHVNFLCRIPPLVFGPDRSLPCQGCFDRGKRVCLNPNGRECFRFNTDEILTRCRTWLSELESSEDPA